MKNNFTLMTLIGLMIIGITGCTDEELTYKIDNKLRGKWETQIINYRGDTFYMGFVEINGVRVNSRGWLFEERKIKLYQNGVVVQTFDDVFSVTSYSDVFEIFYLNDASESVLYVEQKGNNSIISPEFGFSDSCKKVNKFSWE